MLTRALLAAVVIALVAAPSATAGDRCTPRGSKTVRQNSQVRVFTLQRNGGLTYYACLRGTGRPLRVGRAFDDRDSLSVARVLRVLVAGTSVAVHSRSFVDIGTEGDESESLFVDDLRPGGRRYSVRVDTADRYLGFNQILLRADGAAAWLLLAAGDYDEIDVLGASARRPRSVAYAKGITRRSLAFAGDGISWVQDGVTRTAAIP